jgi:hypothetical protein
MQRCLLLVLQLPFVQLLLWLWQAPKLLLLLVLRGVFGCLKAAEADLAVATTQVEAATPAHTGLHTHH